MKITRVVVIGGLVTFMTVTALAVNTEPILSSKSSTITKPVNSQSVKSNANKAAAAQKANSKYGNGKVQPVKSPQQFPGENWKSKKQLPGEPWKPKQKQ